MRITPLISKQTQNCCILCSNLWISSCTRKSCKKRGTGTLCICMPCNRNKIVLTSNSRKMNSTGWQESCLTWKSRCTHYKCLWPKKQGSSHFEEHCDWQMYLSQLDQMSREQWKNSTLCTCHATSAWQSFSLSNVSILLASASPQTATWMLGSLSHGPTTEEQWNMQGLFMLGKLGWVNCDSQKCSSKME